jgi:hypothetical protein
MLRYNRGIPKALITNALPWSGDDNSVFFDALCYKKPYQQGPPLPDNTR